MPLAPLARCDPLTRPSRRRRRCPRARVRRAFAGHDRGTDDGSRPRRAGLRGRPRPCDGARESLGCGTRSDLHRRDAGRGGSPGRPRAAGQRDAAPARRPDRSGPLVDRWLAGVPDRRARPRLPARLARRDPAGVAALPGQALRHGRSPHRRRDGDSNQRRRRAHPRPSPARRHAAAQRHAPARRPPAHDPRRPWPRGAPGGDGADADGARGRLRRHAAAGGLRLPGHAVTLVRAGQRRGDHDVHQLRRPAGSADAGLRPDPPG